MRGPQIRIPRIARIDAILVYLVLTAGCQQAPERASGPPASQTFPRGMQGRLQSSRINECSGIVRGRVHPDVFWVHNDSGDRARIFAIGREGELVAEIEVRGARHVDWEDIAADDAGNLYVCDLGNNQSDRHDLAVYVIPEPDPTEDGSVMVTATLRVRYPDQTGFPDPTRNFDCEAVFWREGELYFLTKHRTDRKTCLYRLSDLRSSAVQDLVLEEEVEVGSMVTGADLSPDGQELAVLSYDYVYLFEIRPGRPLLTGGRAWRLRFEARQSEAIAYDDGNLWIVNEQSEIHRIDRMSIIRAGEVRAPGAAQAFRSPSGTPEDLSFGYGPPADALELAEEGSVAIPVRPARGENGEPAPTSLDSVAVSLEDLGDRLRLTLRWPGCVPEESRPLAYLAWGPRTDRIRLDPGAGDRGVSLVVTGAEIVAQPLEGPLPDLQVALSQRPSDRLVEGTVILPVGDRTSCGLNLILLAPGGGEWSWGGEWSMRSPFKPWLWGTVTLRP